MAEEVLPMIHAGNRLKHFLLTWANRLSVRRSIVLTMMDPIQKKIADGQIGKLSEEIVEPN